MARITIDKPATECFVYSTDIRPRISDINYVNHLGHDRLFGLLHEVRIRFLTEHGFSETNTGGRGIIMSDLAANYKAQVNYGDNLKVDLALFDPTKVGCTFFYLVSREEKEVARAVTGIVFFDYQAGRLCPIPEDFSRLIP